MIFFNIKMQLCISGLTRYNYTYQSSDTKKPLTLQREPTNKYDKNVIKVYLDDKMIGYISRMEASVLAPILDTTKTLHVKKWIGLRKLSTDGYMIIHAILKG